jgi:hypothetical protein
MKASVFVSTDLRLETQKNVFMYPKGSLIQVEVDTSDDVFVVHHHLVETENDKKEKIQTVESKYLRFTRLEDVRFFTGAVLLETQISKRIDFKDITMDEALFNERLSPAHISRYLGGSSIYEKTYTKEDKEYIRVPVMVRETLMEPTQKINELIKFDRIDTSKIKHEDIISLSAREKGNANDTGYLVALERIVTGDTDTHIPEYVFEELKEKSQGNWDLKLVEGKIHVDLKGQRPATLNNLVSSLPVSLNVEAVAKDGSMVYEVSIQEKTLETVVESYYTREVAYDKYNLVEGVPPPVGAPAAGDNAAPAEGSPCTSNGKQGTLQKQGESLVCMVKESIDPSFNEDILEGDICSADGKNGYIKEDADGNLCCMISESSINDKGKEEILEVVLFSIPKKTPQQEAQFAVNADSSSPNVGDPCDYQGQTGSLQLINGALICSLGGKKPAGADGAN